MNNFNKPRRRFLQSALATALLAGTTPALRTASAAPAPLNNRLLLNLFLNGGPDMRHLVVPEYDATPGTLANAYWQHRARAHALAQAGQTAEERWNQDYVHFTVNGSGWPSGLVDINGLNSGLTFGIWREAGWLIDMFRAGKVAMVFNAVGGQNRAHDHSSLQLHQGNILSELNDQDRSGWGGRVARSAGGNSISVTQSLLPYCFGPAGSATNYNPNKIDNANVISISDSREIGMNDYDPQDNQFYSWGTKIARASKTYHQSLRNSNSITRARRKFLEHEEKARRFGNLINQRLATVDIPETILALYSESTTLNQNANQENRRVLRDRYFGGQIRNVFDLIACNDLLTPRSISMEYGGWDSHDQQRRVPAGLADDPNNPDLARGIENGFRDIFGGQIGSNPTDPNALHGGYSALWNSLSQNDKNNLVITAAGEFGRQIRDNAGFGTDHGKGNLMFVIGERVRGGLYGAYAQDDELAKYSEPSYRTPDITPRTELDQLFSKVADWVYPNSGTQVFPRMSSGYGGERPIIEVPGMFNNLFRG